VTVIGAVDIVDNVEQGRSAWVFHCG